MINKILSETKGERIRGIRTDGDEDKVLFKFYTNFNYVPLPYLVFFLNPVMKHVLVCFYRKNRSVLFHTREVTGHRKAGGDNSEQSDQTGRLTKMSRIKRL